MKYNLLTWTEAFASNSDECGGKGWNLARLHHHGFKIPKGGVISTTLYRSLVCCAEIQFLFEQIKTLPDQALTADCQTLVELQQIFVNLLLPDIFKQSLHNFLTVHSLNNSAVAVRSSVNEEDSETASFAGIHKTSLNVAGQAQIEQAILACFASLWTPHAIIYRRKMKISDDKINAAVVICEMVPAETAGVVFSCDPASGRHDVIAINANFGLGESVVTGRIEPDQYLVTRFNKQVIQQHIGNKQQQCQLASTGGIEWRSTPSPLETCLNSKQIIQLANLSDRIFHALGQGKQHQDIEWAFDGQQFVLLQARPVTRLNKVLPKEISDQPEIWSNGNFRDAVPMVTTHLVSEFCDYHINAILHANFDGIYPLNPAYRFGRQFKGRFYCNVSLLQWLWFDAMDFPPEKTNINMGGHQPVINIDTQYQQGFKIKLKRIWHMLKFFRLLQHYRKKSAQIFKEETDFSDHARKIDFESLSNERLATYLQKFDSRLSQYNRSFIILTSHSGTINLLVQTLEKHVGERAWALANELMANRGNITSANHGYELKELSQLLKKDKQALAIVLDENFSPTQWKTLLPETSAFKQGVKDFIDRYGHRAIYEIDLSRPRWRENPSYLFECIKDYLSIPANNTKVNTNLKESKAWQEVQRNIPFYMHGQIRKQIAMAIKGSELKELSKSTYIRLMEPIRLALLAAGKRLNEKRIIESQADIFHCAKCEIMAILQSEWNGATLRELINARKSKMLEHTQLSAPDVIINDAPQAFTTPTFDENKTIHGLSAAMGIATGYAKLIHTPEEGNKLKNGDVLVAASTDPAWTPLFLKASAIVMETGGYLSHGSIVAREYGIPAVVNIPGLLSIINENDKLLVNGDQGLIQISQ